MFKKYLCCSLGLGVADVCNASAVQLYGLLDQGVHVHIQKNTSAHDDIEIKQGNKMASRFGLKGREEISPSHFVFFNLEADTHHTHPSTLFKRRNYIGYENPQLGQFTLGLQSSVGFDIARLIDPSGLIRQKYVIDDLSGTFSGRYGNKWIDQAIKYSYRNDKLQLMTSYQFGSTETKIEPNMAIGLSYKMGDTLVAGSYSMTENRKFTHHEGNSQIINGGVTHQIGKVNLKLGFSHSDLASPKLDHSHQSLPMKKLQNIGIGFKYQAKPHLDYFVAAYRQKASLSTSGDLYGNKFVIGANYHLSKRTHIYGFLNHANGSHSGKVINDITSATVGLVHRF